MRPLLTSALVVIAACGSGAVMPADLASRDQSIAITDLVYSDGVSADLVPACVPNPGCANPVVAPCLCTSTPFPVCGTDYQSYTNPGFAACACTQILHDGACLAGEGAACTVSDGGSGCGAGLYCKAATLRCTKDGS